MGWLSNIFGRRSAKPAGAATQPADAYLGLRGIALGLRDRQAAELGATADEPLAMLMEFHAGGGGGVVTLAGVADGSTSLYFSTGGGIIGAGGHAPVAAATHAWLGQAAEFASQMTRATDFPLPAPGRVRFYLVYSGRVLTAEAAETDLRDDRYPLAPLYRSGHAVITQVRRHTPEH